MHRHATTSPGTMSRRDVPQVTGRRRRRTDTRACGSAPTRDARAGADRRRRRGRHARAERVPAHRHATTPSPSSSSTSRWARASTPACRRSSPKNSTPRGRRCASRARRPTPRSTTTRSGAAIPGQGTGGSTAIANSFEQYRAGRRRRARDARRRRRASNGRCRRTRSQVKNGVVSHASGKKATFGELADAAAKQPVPATVKLKDAKDFVFIGKHVPRTDSQAKSNGTARFTQDVKLPDMLTAVVAHPPRFGAEGEELRLRQRRRACPACATSSRCPTASPSSRRRSGPRRRAATR